MLQTLLSSAPARPRWASGTLVSTAFHGGVFAVLVLCTAKPGPVVSGATRLFEQRVTYMVSVPSVSHPVSTDAIARRRTTKHASARHREPAKPNFAAIQQQVTRQIAQSITVPDATAVPDMSTITDAWAAIPDSLSTPAASIGQTMLAALIVPVPVDGIYSGASVDRTVEERRGNPRPKYPESLRSRGVEGAFLVRFVVDTTGEVLDDRIQFPAAMHELFANAVRTALHQSRYFPAQIAGRVVRQLVEQEFRFTLVR